MQFDKNELYSINIDKLCNSFEDYKIDNNFIKPLEQYSTEYLINEFSYRNMSFNRITCY